MTDNPYKPGSAQPVAVHEVRRPLTTGRRIGSLVLLVVGALAVFYASVASYISFYVMEVPAEQRRPAQVFAIAMAIVAIAFFWAGFRLRRGKSLRFMRKDVSGLDPR